MNSLTVALMSIGIIVLFFLLIGILYFIVAQRRRAIMLKKVDYLVEDITYKSETLTSTVDTVAKVSNYVDVFEVFARKNFRSLTRVISRNKDDIYKILDRIKHLAMGPEEKTEKKPNRKSRKGSK